eukprot:876369-Prorocentrum_minimum.AAC.1
MAVAGTAAEAEAEGKEGGEGILKTFRAATGHRAPAGMGTTASSVTDSFRNRIVPTRGSCRRLRVRVARRRRCGSRDLGRKLKRTGAASRGLIVGGGHPHTSGVGGLVTVG